MPSASASRANGKKGGRPKGRKSARTIEREAVLQQYRDRVCQQAQRLLDAELTVAQGCSYLWRKSNKALKGEARKAERVTDEATIRRYLDGELDNDPNDYYFITTEKPDTLTIRNMLDRTFDRPAQRTEVTGPDGGPVAHVVTFEEVHAH